MVNRRVSVDLVMVVYQFYWRRRKGVNPCDITVIQRLDRLSENIKYSGFRYIQPWSRPKYIRNL